MLPASSEAGRSTGTKSTAGSKVLGNSVRVCTDGDRRGLDDTDSDAYRVQVAILRTLSVSRRLAQVDQLFELTTTLALADLRRLHPDAS